MRGIILHRASIASGELDFCGGRILKILRIVSPAVLIGAQGNTTWFLQRTYLGFHIEPSLPLVAEEDEDTQGLPDLRDPFKWPCLQNIWDQPNMKNTFERQNILKLSL